MLAAFSIAMVRGLLLNVGLHQAASNALGLPCTWPPQVLFIASFMTVFAVVIAIAKDLPDVEGDREYKARALSPPLRVPASCARHGQPPAPPPRTKWTRRFLHPVLIGHASSLTPY